MVTGSFRESDLGAVFGTDGAEDVDVSRISSCESSSLTWCERCCDRYYSCDTVALANDMLVCYELLRAGVHDTHPDRE